MLCTVVCGHAHQSWAVLEPHSSAICTCAAMPTSAGTFCTGVLQTFGLLGGIASDVLAALPQHPPYHDVGQPTLCAGASSAIGISQCMHHVLSQYPVGAAARLCLLFSNFQRTQHGATHALSAGRHTTAASIRINHTCSTMRPKAQTRAAASSPRHRLHHPLRHAHLTGLITTTAHQGDRQPGGTCRLNTPHMQRTLRPHAQAAKQPTSAGCTNPLLILTITAH